MLGAALFAGPAYGALVPCVASPDSGPPGTSFFISCSGFSANTHLNAYVVEPDQRAISSEQVVGFAGNLKTDADGNVEFAWHTPNGGEDGFSPQIGTWTWVVHELTLGEVVVTQGQVNVEIESVDAPQAGGDLFAESDDGQTWFFSGSGFDRDEYVNIWVTLPINCSGRFNVEGASADEPFNQGAFDGFFGPNSVKADEDGEISFAIVFSSFACRGQYSVTARALGSGVGAIVAFEVTGDVPAATLNTFITVTPDSVDALNPYITILGSGFNPGEGVNCWTTRPDGRSFSLFGSVVVDASGSFAWSSHASDFDSFWPFASEEPGLWSVTCREPSTGTTALATFMVNALTSDP
jgi:hypothetical protein